LARDVHYMYISHIDVCMPTLPVDAR